MFTRWLVLLIVLVLLAVPLTSAAPDESLPNQIGTFLTAHELIVRYAPWHFRFEGVPFTPDNLMPAGSLVDVFGTYYEQTGLVWCYITPALDWMIPCGEADYYWNPNYSQVFGTLAVNPGHDHMTTVTKPG